MFKFTRNISTSIISLASIVLATGIVPIEVASKSNVQLANADHRPVKSWIDETRFINGNNYPPTNPTDSGSFGKIIYTFPREDTRSWDETKADCISRGGDDITWIGDHKACKQTTRYNN